jgi:tripartite-type tricarboxylate transporter receptor subunit TctC
MRAQPAANARVVAMTRVTLLTRAPVRSLLMAVAMACAHPAVVAAQQYPDRPIRFVVPFPAGGGNEITARALAEGMTRDLGQQVVIEIKPGAGTIVGTEYAVTRPPDGYTILMASLSHVVNPSLQARLPYDPVKSIAPVALIGRFANVVVAPLERPFRTMAELITHARANPGKLNYGSFGTGTSPHMFPELMKSMARLDITHVPYKGAAPALIDVMGGRLDMVFSTAAGAAPHIRSGKVRQLAVTSGERSSFWPDVPTVAEAGVPGYDAQAFYGILAPAGTPPAIIERLVQAVRVASRTELFQRRAKEDGIEIDVRGPEETGRFMRAEEEKWRKVVRDAGIKPE